MVLAAAESGRTYGADDLRLAEELAARASLAVDNARLYAAQFQNHEGEEIGSRGGSDSGSSYAVAAVAEPVPTVG